MPRPLAVLSLFLLLTLMGGANARADGPATQRSLPATGAPGSGACSAATPCARGQQPINGSYGSADLISMPLTVVEIPAAAQAGPGFEGSRLGMAVMAILGFALLYALVIMLRAALGKAVPSGPDWTEFVIPVLCVIGLGVAGYLTYVETRQVAAVCGPVGDCNTVQSSPYATLFGVLPVGLLGVLGYLAILVAWAIGYFGRGRLAELAPLAVFGFALFGVLFSIYLTYLELAIILAICMWCLTSAVIMSLMLVFSTNPALSGLVGEGAEA